MKKKVLIDLDKLKIPYCGLGNVAINFGNKLFDIQQDEFEWEVLVSETQSVSHLDYSNFSIQKLSLLKKKNIRAFDKSADLVHVTNQMIKYFVSKGKKNIVTIHDLNYVYEEPEEIYSKKLQKLQRHVDNATLITVISNFTKKVVEEYLTIPEGTEIIVVPNGVEPPQKDNVSKPSKVSSDRFFFTIGTIMPKKNFHVLVEMMKYIGDDYHLYIGGQLSKPEYVETINSLITEHGLEDRVKLLGEVTTEEKNYLYHNCSGFLFPSLYEGFGLPIIEAMYCGKPVFSSNLTSLPEVGGDMACYWENFAPQYMANIVNEGLAKHLQNEEANSQKLIDYASQFTWEKNAQAYFELYQKLLS
ncbi:glycosyltransferase [Flammeovirga yaeyamensis]|uniref:Glycosyltransferase n=1 Tax=Flammeovirga yaeyamensis TaxID=367791 RepID=A0AAX1N9G3_9BACT|nr:glycosyltransferase family 1 protein [Flammeovirga yaeyamensis]MBB3701441.1 glycosyltransferase involved in cell wall biosynthesis [Flammeovirga yaeyamensis]NMF38527.1 glycosyltransferase family 4 protein [Flammeovirga yaeyamensis]QWG02393.1 glycosyltransferase [Flammeovirga yaeyamensis]